MHTNIVLCKVCTTTTAYKHKCQYFMNTIFHLFCEFSTHFSRKGWDVELNVDNLDTVSQFLNFHKSPKLTRLDLS